MGNIPWHRHTTICWSFHQWIDTWVASNLGQLWRLYAYKFLGRHIFLLFIGKYLSEIAGSYGGFMFTFIRHWRAEYLRRVIVFFSPTHFTWAPTMSKANPGRFPKHLGMFLLSACAISSAEKQTSHTFPCPWAKNYGIDQALRWIQKGWNKCITIWRMESPSGTQDQQSCREMPGDTGQRRV